MAVLPPPPRDSGSVASIRAVLPVASPAYVLLVRQAGTPDQPLLGTSALEAMLPVTIMFLCL